MTQVPHSKERDPQTRSVLGDPSPCALILILSVASVAFLTTPQMAVAYQGQHCSANCSCPRGGECFSWIYTSLCGYQYNVCVTWDYNCANDYPAVCSSTACTVTVVVKDSVTGGAVSGATVYLDNVSKGTTDYTGRKAVTGVSRGWHTVMVKKTGYQDVTQQVSVQGSTTVTISLRQAQTGFTLTVSVKNSVTRAAISGAYVYLDGVLKGTTDYMGKLVITGVRSGSHTIAVRKTGYQYTTKQSYVTGNVSITILLQPV